MESAALGGHGASKIHQSRFRDFSDKFDVFICKTCKLLVDDANESLKYAFCRRCQASEPVRKVVIPFTLLIVSLELLSTGIAVLFELEDDEKEKLN
jgi:DNA-directed RNA polymerase beta subunit